MYLVRLEAVGLGLVSLNNPGSLNRVMCNYSLKPLLHMRVIMALRGLRCTVSDLLIAKSSILTFVGIVARP